jgi:PKD repeat protein
MFGWNNKSKRVIEASTLSCLLLLSVLTVTYAYVEPDDWASPEIWVQDDFNDASGGSGQPERELLYLGVDYDENYLYVRWDVEEIPDAIEQIYYLLAVAVGTSTVTEVATHSLQFDVDRNGGMSISIRTPNQPKFVIQWTGDLTDWSVTSIPIDSGDPFTNRTVLEGRFPWSVLTGGNPTNLWILTAQSHASASDQGWTSAVKDVIPVQDGISPPDIYSPAISNVSVIPSVGPIGTLFTINVDAFDPSGITSVIANIQQPDEIDRASILLIDPDSDGTYTGSWDSSGENVGPYVIDIIAKDTLNNSGEDDNTAAFSVTKISSSITCSVSPLTLILGEGVTVSGTLDPLLSGKTITLNFTRPDGSTFTRTVTAILGEYSDLYTPDMVGTWGVFASWDGDASHEDASSSPTAFSVTKISSSITCSVSPLTLILGEEVTVMGGLDPLLSDKVITLTFTRPDGSVFTRSVVTTFGAYSDTFTPDFVGSWSVSAWWAGDASHEDALSLPVAFTVHVAPEASFTYAPSTNLSIFTLINFSDTSMDLDGSIVSWLWDFGDTSNSSDPNPTHMYDDKGIYIVTLTVSDNDGYVDNSSQSIIITNLPPTANFTYSPDMPVVGQDIIFTDLSEDPEGKILTYSWNFGDATTSTDKHPHHAYAAYGTYTVTLIVTDDESATDTHSTTYTVKLSSSISCSASPFIFTVGNSVTVSGVLDPSFEGEGIRLAYNMPGGPTFIKTTTTGSDGSFNNTYTPDATGPWSVVASWNGNLIYAGTSSLATFLVSNISTSLSCSVSPDISILGDEVTVTGSLNPKLVGKPIDLLYIRPDSSTLQTSVLTDLSGNYTHTFIPDMFGNWSIAANWIGEATYDAASNSSAAFTVHVAPVASFTYAPSTNLTVFTLITFSDTSTDLDGTLLSWLWDFGDDTTSNTQNPIHMYEVADDYNLTLTVTENDGYTNMTSHLITIHETTIVPTSITCSVSLFAVPVGGSPTIPSGVPPGSLITVSGAISLPISNTTVTLTYTKPDGSTFTRTVSTTLGEYNDTFTPDMVGTWSVSSSWEGQAIILGASSSLQSFTISSITCSVLASEIPFGSSITVSGTINTALSDVPITLTYTTPNGSMFTMVRGPSLQHGLGTLHMWVLQASLNRSWSRSMAVSLPRLPMALS